ncbi:VWA domain-containing protein [Leucobacter weissii]|uniref:VWA domain-containing protein n=1 Tax=Leucobacter weissii TaxID=1983706 RepID=A0A939S978_9MICO|nr:vWA domain-containing protein [Leucobacter weissii]MBO1902861.1 VWA domain-containing protein [Leucobacter weissii]
MATDSGRRADDPLLRARLAAVGRLLAVPIAVDDGEEWTVEGSAAEGPGLLRVGLGFYRVRGFGADEAEALALLELWGTAKTARTAPERMRRRMVLAGRRPELEPLLAAIDRLQASGELLAAMPAFRGALSAATLRSLPEEPRGLPKHLQFVAALLQRVLAPGAGIDTDDAVRAELGRIDRLGDPGADPLRRISAPDRSRSQLLRLERALALLLAPYERLLARDASARGLTDRGELSGPGDPASHAFGASGGPGDPDALAEAATGEHAGDAPADPDDGAGARPGERRETSEGADLFAAERAGFVETVIATPMPAHGSLASALLPDVLPDLADEGLADSGRRGDPAGGAVVRTVAPADYRRRLERRRAAIEEVRRLWWRIVSERLVRRPANGRRAEPEGDLLDGEALARIVAETRAGVRRPGAFRRREHRPRRRSAPGRTDYVFLIDRSASMTGAAAEAAADAALVMLEALAGAQRDIAEAERISGLDLELGIRTALIVFDAEPLVVKPLSAGVDDEARRRLLAEIRSPGGATNDAAALAAACSQLATAPTGDEHRRIVFVVGDGGSNDPAAARNELRRLRTSGVAVIGIGLGSDEFARRYAPSGLRLDDPSALADVLTTIIERELPELIDGS